MQDSVFTKIIRGDIPSHKIYEDDLTLAILDVHPFTPGHVLVIPKKQIDHIWDLPDADFMAVMAVVKVVGTRIRNVLEPPRVGVKVIGTDVPHAHVHVFPFSDMTEYNKTQDTRSVPDYSSLEQMARRLTLM